VRHSWRDDSVSKLEPVKISADAVEQTLAGTEKSWRETENHFVHQTSVEIFLRSTCSAGE
jgi:hypothetical protein